jgi:hypothetical protein
LAINTSFEAIDKLTCKATVLEMDLADLKKQFNETIKTSSSAGNKADDAKRQSNDLIKRVKKLEEKRA